MPRPRPSHLAPDTLPPPRHWSVNAACKEEETEIFYPGPSNPGVNSAYAKTFCARCPVRAQCLEEALARREEYGVWGGLDEKERGALFRNARLAAQEQRRKEKEARQVDATSSS
ncbi:WhiB family transcriptional regulator [Streptomyces microflavus]|uniref:WhiB family transcriptional regulator n=1 Tax=Streptomyces microflavus TaxID=1919 RepID=UPI00365EE4D7